MKILYLHQYFVTPAMSGGTRSYEMARRLVASGHEVHMITSWRDSSPHVDWFDETIEGIHVHWLPVRYNNSMGFRQRMMAFARFAMKAGEKARQLGGDVVFATSTPLTIAIPGAFAAARLKVPMVFEVRDLWPEVPIAMGILRNPVIKAAARWLERFAYSRSSHIVALSKGMADGVADSGFARSRISVIPNNADLQLFRPDPDGARRFRQAHPELGEGPIILYPGTLGKANGVTYLARLASGLLGPRPDVRVVVIGDGAEAEIVRTTARELGVLDANFFQYSSIPKRDLVDAFRAASVVVSAFIDEPALWANSANKFFDTLASGTAVAINYKGWQAELLTESDVGIVLSPDPDQAIAPMLDFLATPSRPIDCGQRARQLAVQRFDPDVLAGQLERILLDATSLRE